MTQASPAHDALHNELLAALPRVEFESIIHALERVELEVGDVLWESEDERQHIYFPTTALICLLYETEDGMSVEAGIIGRQGLVGVCIYMGDPHMADRAVVFRAGVAYRMKAREVTDEFSDCGDFQDMMMCYTQTVVAQISQSSLCNRLHNVEQQLCRLLLIAHDHQLGDEVGQDTILMTHEQMSCILGVRRESVSLAAAALKDKGIIEYARGHITLLDRNLLEDGACECYGVENEHYKRILGQYIRHHK
jgi:CRP-like cAMP-binding protein